MTIFFEFFWSVSETGLVAGLRSKWLVSLKDQLIRTRHQRDPRVFLMFSLQKNHRKKEEQKIGKKWCFTWIFPWIEGQVKPCKTTRTHETGRETHPGLPSDGVSCAHPHCIINPDEISTKKLHRLSQVIINYLWYGIIVIIIYYHY